ncbi:MAG: 6-bladed beta-propeller [Bacteroidota bacterium]
MNKVLLFTLLLALACTSKKLDVTHFTINPEANRSVSISDMITDLQVIPLEMTEGSFMREAAKIVAHEGQLYILDRRSSAIFVFTENGVFLDRIANPIEGPGGIDVIVDFNIGPSGSTVELLSPKGKIVEYDFLNRSYKEILNDFENLVAVANFAIMDEDTRVFYSSRNSRRLLYYSIDKREVVSTQYDKSPIGASKFSFFSPFKEVGNELYFMDPSENSLYIREGAKFELVEQYRFTVGDPIGIEWPQQFEGTSTFSSFLEENALYYPMTSFRYTDQICGFSVAHEGSENISFITTRDSGNWIRLDIPYNERVVPFLSSDGDYFWGVILDANLVQEIFSQSLLDKYGIHTPDEVDDTYEANPVLFKYRLSIP